MAIWVSFRISLLQSSVNFCTSLKWKYLQSNFPLGKADTENKNRNQKIKALQIIELMRIDLKEIPDESCKLFSSCLLRLIVGTHREKLLPHRPIFSRWVFRATINITRLPRESLQWGENSHTMWEAKAKNSIKQLRTIANNTIIQPASDKSCTRFSERRD